MHTATAGDTAETGGRQSQAKITKEGARERSDHRAIVIQAFAFQLLTYILGAENAILEMCSRSPEQMAR